MVPCLVTHVKDHKPPPENPKKDIPKSRGICLARSSINTRLSDVLSDIIVSLVSKKPRQNVKSTEELLNKMEAAAEIIEKKSKNLVVASMDVVGLYPNLDIRKSAKAVGETASSTDIELVNANWEWAQKFVAMNLSQAEIEQEGLEVVIPRRRS